MAKLEVAKRLFGGDELATGCRIGHVRAAVDDDRLIERVHFDFGDDAPGDS